jgi:glucan phosphoethanolaminetransferase (alkaline phosphatase superfamily)
MLRKKWNKKSFSMPKFNRTKVNFYIDLTLLIVFAALIGVGLLIKFVLIPGQERWLLYGQNMELTFWGLNRHEWGTIHLITGIVFFVLFILHIIFHWNMIKCMFWNCIKPKVLRTTTVIVALFLFAGLIVFPFFVEPQKTSIQRGEGHIKLEGVSVDLNDSIRVKLKKPKKLKGEKELELDIQKKKTESETRHSEDKKHKKQEIDITGSMTLNDVVEKYNCPLSKLIEELELPDDIDGSERLGHLRKKYGFRLGDVKEIVLQER